MTNRQLNTIDFSDQAWSQHLLSSPDLVRTTIESQRQGGGPTGPHENSFFSKTINTPTTVRACIPLRHKNPDPFKMESLMLLSLGTDLSGHSSLLCGGMVGVLMDEIMGLAATHVSKRDQAENFFTAELRIKYKMPVPTPGLALCKAKCVKVEGRRLWTEGTIEDGHGKVYAEGHATWIKAKVASL